MNLENTQTQQQQQHTVPKIHLSPSQEYLNVIGLYDITMFRLNAICRKPIIPMF